MCVNFAHCLTAASTITTGIYAQLTRGDGVEISQSLVVDFINELLLDSSCEECSKSFSQAEDLKNHMTTTASEKDPIVATPTVYKPGPSSRIKLRFASPNVSPAMSNLKWPGTEKASKSRRRVTKPGNVKHPHCINGPEMMKIYKEREEQAKFFRE